MRKLNFWFLKESEIESFDKSKYAFSGVFETNSAEGANVLIGTIKLCETQEDYPVKHRNLLFMEEYDSRKKVYIKFENRSALFLIAGYDRKNETDAFLFEIKETQN